VPIHGYSLSTELNPNWSTFYADQPEILAYWERIFEKHDLRKFTSFNTVVTSLEWIEDEQRYHIILENVASGDLQETNAEVVISAVGIFRDPAIPSDITNVEKFKGVSWHSACWRHDVDLSGKRVGVIGNGCSA
jgi:cation diffusion facilitator CzcD-associated flavoprotein CzcO